MYLIKCLGGIVMKKLLKGLMLIVIIAMLALMPEFIDYNGNTVKANEAGWSEDSSDSDELDAYTIVEILPYKGLSEIGYLVGGQEPIDKEFFEVEDAHGNLSFLGDAISDFPSYAEKPMPSTGTPDTDWAAAKTIANQNGYFVLDDQGTYKQTIGDNYIRVAEGTTGSYRAEIDPLKDMEATYNFWGNPTNRKNVKAQFVFGNPSGVALYKATVGYLPISVTAVNPKNTGDYDYDIINKRFILTEGTGDYDVIFQKTWDTTNVYHMKANYEIVDDNSGPYSFDVKYVAQAGGNYRKETGAGGKIFTYDQWNGQYRWVQDDTALTKPTNYFVEGGKTWVKSQKVNVLYQFKFNTELINNELFKRKVLGIPASLASDYPVRVFTTTPENLSKPENQHYIEEADLFYINDSAAHNPAYISLYEEKSVEGRNLLLNQKYSAIQ